MLALMRCRRSARGFTLVELLVVLALVAILATLAVPSFERAIANQKLNVAASDLMVSAMQARGEAIKNNRQAIVQPLVSTDWSKGWRIYVDMDNDKAYTEGTDLLVTTVAAAASSVTQYEAVRNAAVGNLIGFDPNGFVLGRDAGRVIFASTTLGTGYKKGVIISITGRARVCKSVPGTDGCTGTS